MFVPYKYKLVNSGYNKVDASGLKIDLYIEYSVFVPYKYNFVKSGYNKVDISGLKID